MKEPPAVGGLGLTTGVPVGNDLPFRIPAELTNTIEPKSEALISQHSLKTPVVNRDVPVGEIPDFFASNIPTPGSTPGYTGTPAGYPGIFPPISPVQPQG